MSTQVRRLDLIRAAWKAGVSLAQVRAKHPSLWPSDESGKRKWRRDLALAPGLVRGDVIAIRRRVLLACLPCTLPEAVAKCPDVLGDFPLSRLRADLYVIGATCERRRRAPGLYRLPEAL